MALWLMMMHYHTKSGYKWTGSSDGIVQVKSRHTETWTDEHRDSNILPPPPPQLHYRGWGGCIKTDTDSKTHATHAQTKQNEI